MQTKTELQKCLQQWKEFDDVYDHCATWLKQAEAQMRTSELFDTLADKQQQLQKLRVSYVCLSVSSLIFPFVQLSSN